VALLALGACCGPLELPRILWQVSKQTPSSGDPSMPALVDAWRTGLLWSGGISTVLVMVLAACRQRPQMAIGLPLLVFAELWHGNVNHLPLVARQDVEGPNAFAEAIRRDAYASDFPGPRVVDEMENPFPSTVTEGGPLWTRGMLHLLRADSSALYGIDNLTSNLGAETVRYAMVFGTRGEKAASEGARFGACYRVTPPRSLRSGEVALSFDDETRFRLVRTGCMPRAYLSAAHAVADKEAALQWMAADKEAVPWEGGPDLARGTGTVHWLTDLPEHRVIEVETDSPTALVISDELAAGWMARVDGEPQSLRRALVVATALAVPPGKHRVEFDYRTPLLNCGAAGSGLGLILILVALLTHVTKIVRNRSARTRFGSPTGSAK
jgi:Bacterial membrane protein YfhO